MPRNNSGVYNLPQQPFFAGSNIIASQVNSNYSDIASTLTMSLASNGSSLMTGPLRGSTGTISELSFTFVNDNASGWYLINTGNVGFVVAGELIFDWTTGAFIISSSKTLSVQDIIIDGEGNQGFDSGTAMLFVQTGAPLGWTKSVTNNNKILRVISSNASTGGTNPFTSIFIVVSLSASIGSTAITVSMLPTHRHNMVDVGPANNSNVAIDDTEAPVDLRNAGGNIAYRMTPSSPIDTEPTLGRTSSVGGGQSHTHVFSSNPVDLDVQYVDVIIAVKDV